MLETLLLPVLLQSLVLPQETYQVEISPAVQEVMQEADPERSEQWVQSLEALAENGDDSAFEALGEIFNFGGFGVAPDKARACDYFEQLEGRRADGLHNLATCYFSGQGRPQDHARARELYVSAAEAGYLRSFCAYGNMLINGQGGSVDTDEGLRLCRMAAVAGDANALTDLGGYLLVGEVVERDPVAARLMLEQAAQQDQRNAMFLLGQIYTKGDGTPTDHRAATDWFKRAYERGRPDAAFETARSLARRGFHEEGGEMFIDRELSLEAIAWLEIAAERDPSQADREMALEMIENLKVLLEAAE